MFHFLLNTFLMIHVLSARDYTSNDTHKIIITATATVATASSATASTTAAKFG